MLWKEARKRTCSPRMWFSGWNPPAALQGEHRAPARRARAAVEASIMRNVDAGQKRLTDLDFVGSVGELAPVLVGDAVRGNPTNFLRNVWRKAVVSPSRDKQIELGCMQQGA